MPLEAPSPRTEVHRLPKRAVYDRAQIESILDSALICHVGFIADGQPVVIPTNFVRVGDHIYLHGSPASRMLRALVSGADACLTVTLLDALVLARSAFHHSVNYRSVVVFGQARTVTDPGEKLTAMRLFIEKVAHGRWDEVRPPNDHEWASTAIVALPIGEASAKIRTGPPIDDEADYALPVWAGVVPVPASVGTPIPDDRNLPGVPAPAPHRFGCFQPREA
jgi:hypothetical protein